MALTINPSTLQTAVINHPICFQASSTLILPQEDLRAVALTSGDTWSYTASSQTFRKTSGVNAYDDCIVVWDENIIGVRPFYIRAVNSDWQTPGGAQNNFSMWFGVMDDLDRTYGFEIFRYCGSVACPPSGGTDWLINIYWQGSVIHTQTVFFNEIFYVRSDGTSLLFDWVSGGQTHTLITRILPVTSRWRFRVGAAFVHNALTYLSVFKGTYQGSVPLTWTSTVGSVLTGTGNTRCITSDTGGIYQICVETDTEGPLCVDVQFDEIYINPTGFSCGGCVFQEDIVTFESNGGLEGTLEVTLDDIPIGTVIDSLTWKAPNTPITDALVTYTYGDDTATCYINVIPRLEVLNITGDVIEGLVPGEAFQLVTNYDDIETVRGVYWENLTCENLVSPTGLIYVPKNFQNGCFGKVDCYIRARMVRFPGPGEVDCLNLAPGGNQEYYKDFRILIDPIYPTPQFGGPHWLTWTPDVPEFKVVTKTMEGGCSETHLKNRVPSQKWIVKYDGLKQDNINNCSPAPCCDDPVGYVNGINPDNRTAQILDDFWMLNGGEYGFFTLVEPRTGTTWRKVRFDAKMTRTHGARYKTLQSRDVTLVWNPCCANAPLGGVCQHNTLITDIIPPTIPENVNAVALSYSTIRVNWEKSLDNIGIQRYELWADGFVLRANSANLYYHRGLDPETEHQYKVRSVDWAGNFSAWSDLASATTLPHDVTPPAIPDNFRYSSLEEAEFLNSEGGDFLLSGTDFLVDSPTTGYGILIEWDAVSAPDVGGYEIIVDGYLIDVGNVTSYLDYPLEYCTEHQYFVRSYDTTGNKSRWTEELVAHTNCGEVDVVEFGFSVTESGNTVIESN